jgi:hypothetical protein
LSNFKNTMVITTKARASTGMQLQYETKHQTSYEEALKTYTKLLIGTNCVLQLNIVYSDEKIGFAVNQILASESIPLTKYYYWPQTDAWRHLRIDLETKPWITFNQRLELLNLAVTIMGLWPNNELQLSKQTTITKSFVQE